MWKYWRLDPINTATDRIGVESIGDVGLGVDEGEYIRAYVKWDGCTIIDDQRTVPYHICELADEVGRWEELRLLALEFFGGDFAIAPNDDTVVWEYIKRHTTPAEQQP